MDAARGVEPPEAAPLQDDPAAVRGILGDGSQAGRMRMLTTFKHKRDDCLKVVLTR